MAQIPKSREGLSVSSASSEAFRSRQGNQILVKLCAMKTLVPIHLIIFSLTCFAFLSKSQAVSPPPDGGYAGGNTAEGQNALLSLTTGTYNTALGIYSNLSLTDGNFCTGVGAGTLLANTADENTAIGAGPLLSNTTGSLNTANGTFALFSNTEGSDNTAIGDNALLSNATGNFNTANGSSALHSNTEGIGNTASGFDALYDNTTGQGNTATGNGALRHNTTGGSNTALGFIAGSNVTTATNVICIGTSGANVDNSCYIGNIFNQTSSSGIPVLINSSNKLGTTTSSKRFKEDIKPMGKSSEGLLALQPVTFRYKKEIDPAGTPQLGLVAEDVEKVNPDLVMRDQEGKPYTVRYDQVNAMLLNEFLKEHRTVQGSTKRNRHP
jgi:Chaperone of endosialidase